MLTITTSDLRWLRHALTQADQAPHVRWRVGAVLVRGGRVVGTGYNRYRNNPSQVEVGEVSYHAEEVALRRAGDARGATLYVARITRSGELGLAKPCHRCMSDIIGAGVSSVLWTTPYGLEKVRTRQLALVV